MPTVTADLQKGPAGGRSPELAEIDMIHATILLVTRPEKPHRQLPPGEADGHMVGA